MTLPVMNHHRVHWRLTLGLTKVHRVNVLTPLRCSLPADTHNVMLAVKGQQWYDIVHEIEVPLPVRAQGLDLIPVVTDVFLYRCLIQIVQSAQQVQSPIPTVVLLVPFCRKPLKGMKQRAPVGK